MTRSKAVDKPLAEQPAMAGNAEPLAAVLAQVKILLAQVCAIPADAIHDDAQLIAYGLDSVRAMDFILAIEDTFGIEVADEQAARLKTIADVADYIRRQMR